MRLRLTFLIVTIFLTLTTYAQRKTDKLDRGLVAVPANVNGGSGTGNFISWKIFAEEYYNVTYNLYANGSLLTEGLEVGCFSHITGTATTKYQVAAVVRGVEQEKSAEVTRWNKGYKDILVGNVLDREGTDITSSYWLNDVSLGDVTGEGTPEFIVKRNYMGGVNVSSNKTRFNLYECYTIEGERLWSIDLGPNLMAGPDEQWDLVAFDWDQDGRAECLMRGADNMIIHTSTGRDIQIGNMNYYAPRDEYTREGAEYLLYLNGATGEPYGWDGTSDSFTPMNYPLPRFETGETDYETAWGKNDTGHRATKHYFGAPFLDGRKASIFLGRGCYTRHKMIALDVDPGTHELTTRWRWANNNGWDDPWFGNGFHNFAIADVDWDGRDEIVFGSMIIDDNGKGLCTTGLGHGDAQHCADLDPYRHGSEQFTCNEDEPACTFYNATTGKIYYRLASSSDDGRALCGNFSNDYPGSIGRSTQTGLVSTVSDKVISGASGMEGSNDALNWAHLNQRIYWDGDLCDEVYDSPGSANEGRAAAIYKYPSGRLFNTDGCLTNNGTKNNPGAIADILGDWREEIVMRTSDNKALRIYTTAIPTRYRIYTLWHDHQYRNAMVWQCVGYNQPPHKSYFLGQLEEITVAPPPLTMTGRTEIPNGGTINSSMNGQHVLVCETNNTSITVNDGAAPAVATFNVPTWVQGTNSSILNGTSKVNTERYTCTVEGGAFTGTTRLVKQGDGILTLPALEQTYSGNTDIWAGTLNFDGKLLQSTLWLNRFAELNSDGGQFRAIKADYAAIVRPGGADKCGQITTDSLILGFGARVQFDIYSEGIASDKISAKLLTIDTRLKGNWLNYGPQYLEPVIELVPHMAENETEIAPGRYLLFEGVEELKGSLDNLVIEGLSTSIKATLLDEDEKIYLVIESVRSASDILWLGNVSADWQLGGDENFALTNDITNTEMFVTGDVVRFTDEAKNLSVNLVGDIDADSVIVDASKNYTFKGRGALVDGTTLVKRGTGNLTIQASNTYSGGTRISEGKVTVSSLSNENQEAGNLGGVSSVASNFIIENGAELATTAAVTMGSPIQLLTDKGGILTNSADFSMNKAFTGSLLVKKGNGWLKQYANSTLKRMVIMAGSVNTFSGNPAGTVEFQGGSLYDDNQATSHAIDVPQGETGTWYLTKTYYTAYANKLTGEGTLTIIPRNTVSRVRITGDWSQFQGTIKHVTKDIWLPLDASTGMAKGTLDVAEGCTVTNVTKSFAIGRLTGKGSLAHPVSNFKNQSAVSGSNTWNVGNSDLGDFTFAGTFTDAGGSNKCNFTKVGSCKMIVSGKNNHSGTTKVNDGELCIKSGGQLGTGALAVAKGAVLSGVTTASVPLTNSTVTIQSGGTLLVGASSAAITGQIDFGGKNVTLNKGSFLQLGINRAATSSSTGGTCLQNIGKLTINATIQLHYSSTIAENLKEGDEVLLWKDVTTVSGTPVLEDVLIDRERCLVWDTTDIAQGILRVKVDPTVGIQGITTKTDDNQAVYSIDGRCVSHPHRGEVYVIGGRKVLK